jgi:hypothetical protein
MYIVCNTWSFPVVSKEVTSNALLYHVSPPTSLCTTLKTPSRSN